MTTMSKLPLMWELMGKAARLNVPFQVALELTYRCNLRCVHCYVDLVERDELSVAEWKGVLDQLKASGTLYLLFTGGEMMVRDDSLDIMTYARSSGFFVGLLTNCTRITPVVARAIADLRPFTAGTSLYGATAATHEAVTRIPGSFRKTLEGIELLVAAGVVPTVQVLTMKDNLGELPQIVELVKSLGAWVKVKTGMSPAKSGADFPFSYEPAELIGLEDETRMNASGPGPCRAGKAICSVSPRGDVFPCIMFPLKLGNLRQSSFESLWRLEPCAELRYLRSMRHSDLYACNVCELRAYCRRCTGSAYLESGRMDGLSTSACRQARMRWRLNQAAEA